MSLPRTKDEWVQAIFADVNIIYLDFDYKL